VYRFLIYPRISFLDSLELIGCSELTTLHLHDSGGARPICSVKITLCERLRELRISRKISQLTIYGCSNLSLLTVERQINFLRVKNCLQLRGISQSAPIICSECKMECGGSEVEDENEENDRDEENVDDNVEEDEENNEE
jgi:hypothetical protein